ncbi:GNAT family N-acetyltransferase [Paracoccus salsus]|uniref:GNAT family N-acetyltransferase n=1 Tax=Paracoccus salsus TaxID=2911061 RepID=UPI001F3486C3|nr:GNAT family N-acetyltransferase [Paracoccus salsus]
MIDAYRPADLESLHRIASAPQVARMLLRFHPGMSLDDTAAILDEQALLPPLRPTVRHRGQVAGSIGLSAGRPARIFCFLDPGLIGQGLGQEMVSAFLDEVVDRFDPQGLLADVFLDNAASRRLLKNLGFQRGEDEVMTSMGRDAPAPAALYRWNRRSRL